MSQKDMQVNFGALAKLAKETEETLRTLLTEDYLIETEKIGNFYQVSAKYQDSFDNETLAVEISLNDFGVPQYWVVIDSTNGDSEVMTPASCHDCEYSFCSQWKRGKCSLSYAKSEKEESEHLAKPKLKVSGLNLETKIISEPCCLNVPHNHDFKGYSLNLKTILFSEVQAVIILRDMLFALYRR